MKIEVGKTYRTRDGGTVTITRDGDDPVTRRRRGSQDPECYAVGGEHTAVGEAEWAADGRFWSFGPSGLDIVEEIGPPGHVVQLNEAGEKEFAPAPDSLIQTFDRLAKEGSREFANEAAHQAIRHDITRLRRGGWFNTAAIIALAIAMIYARTANATDIAAMPNAAGGEIVLTTDRGGCPDLYLLAYSRGDNGTVITGCWLPGTRYVLIKWSESGIVKLFAYDQFTPLVRQVPAAERRL
jgi:hypothetical protein